MITVERAFQIARNKLNEYEEQPVEGEKLQLLDDLTLEFDFGWVFFYNTERFIKDGNYAYALAGNSPLIVDRVDGSIHHTGTAKPIDYYIEQYRNARREVQ